MAAEILVAGIADLKTTEVMSSIFLLLLAEREDILGHPALVYAGAAEGSNVVRVPQIGLGGYDLLSAGTEGTALSNTALTDASADITVAWYGKSYEQSDLAQMVAANGLLDPAAFAMDAAVSIAQTLLNLVAGLGDTFSTVVGSTGVDATHQNFIDAITALEINKAPGPYLSLLHPRQWGDLRTDAQSLGGAGQYRADAQGSIAAATGQFGGQLYGVDVFKTSTVPTMNAGADRGGCMFGRGAIAWADAIIPAGDANMINMGRGALERVRSGKAGLTAYVSHAYLGVVECIDAAGVTIQTDA